MERSKIVKIRKTLIEWGKANYTDFPWRSTKNSFHALVAEIMLQRTRAQQVVSIYNAFIARYLRPQAVVYGNPTEILKLLEPLGLRWRARKILELAQELEKRCGTVPDRFEELVRLPGVGPYAASAYLSLHVNVRASITDANAVRLWGRVFGFKVNKETRRNKEFLCIADKLTPKHDFKIFNYAVLDHTRTICKRKPLCTICTLNRFCSCYLHAKCS